MSSHTRQSVVVSLKFENVESEAEEESDTGVKPSNEKDE